MARCVEVAWNFFLIGMWKGLKNPMGEKEKGMTVWQIVAKAFAMEMVEHLDDDETFNHLAMRREQVLKFIEELENE